MKLHKTPSNPLYLQIADYIRERIYRKEWGPGYRVPSETEMMEEFDASRGTVRKAIATLVDEELLERVQGSGTYVRESSIIHPGGNRPLSFAESLRRQGLDYVTEVVECRRMGAEEAVAERLWLHAGDPVLRLVRVRSVDGEPIMLLESWVPLSVCPDIDTLPLKEMSLFDAVEQTSGRRICVSRMSYSARVAGKERGRLLHVAENAPILNLEQLIMLEDGTPIEWGDTSLCAGQTIVGIGRNQRSENDL